MRALWLVRGDLTQHPGGDTTQIVETANALRALGVGVELAQDPPASLSGFDLVHLWHLDRLWENLPHCRRIRAAGIPAVLSTIYWPSEEYESRGRTGVQGALSRAVGMGRYQSLRLFQRWAISALRGGAWSRPVFSFQRAVRQCLQSVRVLLPNSRAEQELIERDFGCIVPNVVVPNAVSDTFGPADANGPEGRKGVLCVGRIEPRKNQLMLIRALNGTDIVLTLVGDAGRYSASYEAECRRTAGENVVFYGRADGDELRNLYRSALVHICPSWYETPGLASLEAALCGCAVVVTPGGCTREYFGEEAHYCRPDDAATIRMAVQSALERGPAAALAKRVAAEFTWAAAAEKTLEGYRLAMAR